MERTIITQATVEIEELVEEIEGVLTLPEENCINVDELEIPMMKSGEELKPTVREDEPKPKPWVEVIQGNRSLNRGMAVDFIAPTFVNGKAEITIDESDVYEELEF